VAAAVRVLEASGAALAWETVAAGAGALATHGHVLPPETLASIRRHRIALKGPITTPVGSGFPSVNVSIRKALDLYANVRPVRSLPVPGRRYEDIDLVVVRENTEGLYSGIEHTIVPGVAVSLQVVTAAASTRIGEHAFGLARAQGRRRVTAVHKANILKVGDGLFLACVRAVAERYPDVAYDEAIVDAMSMHLVLHPQRYDVLVTGNMYGDIISDLAAGLVGGLGLVPSGNIGQEIAVFEAVHGSAPDIAGQGIANPAALILSGAMLLRHIGEPERAAAIEQAVRTVVAGPPGTRTRDLGGTATTVELTDAVIAALGS
jgi:isocitrate dehydrogenase (NAD+)